jgi:hypothetical protein
VENVLLMAQRDARGSRGDMTTTKTNRIISIQNDVSDTRLEGLLQA